VTVHGVCVGSGLWNPLPVARVAALMLTPMVCIE
jgi:hypothetical protein